MDDTKHSLLVAEDDPDNLELLRRRLSSKNYNVIFTTNGRKAIDVLQSGEYAFSTIILDRSMPEVDGMGVLAYIKSDPKLKDIPVILQTALSDSQSVTEGIAAGAFYYLTKPYQKDLLNSIVASAVNDYERTVNLRGTLDKQQKGMRLLTGGLFEFRTIEEATELASILANMCPRPDTAVSGISELLNNAVEHGNLAISYQDKTQLLQAGQWLEEIDRRLNDPRFQKRVVKVQWQRKETSIDINIQDEGDGFRPDPYLTLDPARLTHSHGRGIAMAIMRSFDEVTYVGKGNQVVASIKIEKKPERE